MKAFCVSLVALLMMAIFGLAIANGAPQPVHAAAVQASDQPDIAVELTALQEPDGVRYSVTVINPSDVPLPGLYALVALPPGANLAQALETDGFTHFLGVLPATQGESLLWSANFIAGDYVDAFVFTLNEAAVGNIGVNLQWAGDHPGKVAFWGQPKVLAASLLENDLTLSAAGTGDALVPVGGTGVLVGAAPGQVPDGTKIHIRLMNPSEDPPVTGDLWWCSAVEVTGLPAGAEITVLVPLRSPLAPGAPVALFSRQPDGTWGKLSAEGIVTFDGQHVAYAHRGGEVATGIQNRFQPTLVKAPLHPIPPTPTRIPPTNPSSKSTAVPTVAIKNPPPPIHITILPRGTPPRNPSIPTSTPTVHIIRVTKPVLTLPPPVQPPATATKPPPSATNSPAVATKAANPPPTVTATTIAATRPQASATSTPAVATKATNATPTATATVGKKQIPSPTATSAPPCGGVPNLVCFAPGGSVTVISLCTRAGVNCISNGNNGTICFTLFAGSAPQCAAPGSTVVFKQGSGGRINPGSFVLLGTATPVVVIVTATFLPQPTICVQDSTGATACTNPNGQFVIQPSATPLPTATLRADGGICFIEQLPNTTDPADIVQICIDATGHECIISLLQQALAQGFGGSATSFCLNPNDPGYISPP